MLSQHFNLQEFEQSDKARGLSIISSWTLTGRVHDVRPPAARGRDKKTDLA